MVAAGAHPKYLQAQMAIPRSASRSTSTATSSRMRTGAFSRASTRSRPHPHPIARMRPRRLRTKKSPQAGTSKTGATGLEPATSGVTGLFHQNDDWGRLTRYRSIHAALRAQASDFHTIAQARFRAFAALLLPEEPVILLVYVGPRFGGSGRRGGRRVGCVYSVQPANRHVASDRPEFWHPTPNTRPLSN